MAASWPKTGAEASKQYSTGGGGNEGGGGGAVPGQPLLLFTPSSLHSLLPISKVVFSVDKPQNLILFEIFFAFK